MKVIRSQSEPGGIHENTFLLVMGDHGGGTADSIYNAYFLHLLSSLFSF
ncbi:hypothetical protein Pint_06135 [Pistacia integerrima]|uniref:Uncharacterized protein n=1 Tax=Pistacia integerrima TaxID=434235 RepID=A0ACC0Z251_9ROSI|nr:hypothetical protein Pint_06135 [Pistacia integerrima]